MRLYVVLWWRGWDIVEVVNISTTRKEATAFIECFHDSLNCEIKRYKDFVV